MSKTAGLNFFLANGPGRTKVRLGSIVEKNYSGGTSTNEKGSFKIDVREANAVLVISYVGYKTIEVAVNGKTALLITLEEDLKSLDDVVVVGYGTQKKINTTGAIETNSGTFSLRLSALNSRSLIESAKSVCAKSVGPFGCSGYFTDRRNGFGRFGARGLWGN